MGLLSKLFRGPDQINDYFFDAVVVFISNSDPVARLAALAAAKVAASGQRASMVNCLRMMAADANSTALRSGPNQSSKDTAYRLNQLADEISLRDWSVRDSMAEKRALMKLNADYCKALNAFDGTFFQRRFPHLFHEKERQATLERLRQLALVAKSPDSSTASSAQ